MTLLEQIMEDTGMTKEEIMRDCIEGYTKIRPKYCPRRCEVCFGQQVIKECAK